jgi:Flp pilus assembly protein TadD
MEDWDWRTARTEVEKALELNPGSSSARQWYGFLFAYQGKAAEARKNIAQARDSDPLSPILQSNVGWTYYIEGDYAHAKEELLRTEQNNPDFWLVPWGLGSTYMLTNQPQEGIAELRKAVELSGRTSGALSALGWAYGKTGDLKQARALLAELKKGNKKPLPSWDIAVVYAGTGDRGQALTWLERAVNEHSQGVLKLKIEPALEPLYNEPRFQALVKKLNLG